MRGFDSYTHFVHGNLVRARFGLCRFLFVRTFGSCALCVHFARVRFLVRAQFRLLSARFR